MFINFALVNPAVDKVEASFEDNGRAVVEDFLIHYAHYFDGESRREILVLSTNELVGFTETETRAILEHYYQAGALQLDVDFCLETMKIWYDGYCFAK